MAFTITKEGECRLQRRLTFVDKGLWKKEGEKI